MKTIYYYYFLFYDRVLEIGNPYTMATLVLSTSQASFFIGIIDIFLLHYFCKSMLKWQMIVLTLLMILINYNYYHKTGRAKEIIKAKPKFFNNNKFSIFITILFVIITFSLMISSADISIIIFNKHSN